MPAFRSDNERSSTALGAGVVDEKWARRISELTCENAAIRREWAAAIGEPGPGNRAKAQASDALLDRFNTNARGA